jgi:ribonuclease R
VRRLGGDWWDLNEEGTILHGSRSGAAIRLGDPIDVRVQRIEASRGRVDLVPVGEER